MQEIEAAVAVGALSEVIYCFSREPGSPRTYVQDGIAAHTVTVSRLLAESNAHLYVCGGAAMATAAIAAVRRSVGDTAVDTMQTEGRVHEDIFG
jgi:sulfite reductase alpha subunit-like flavoprotein